MLKTGLFLTLFVAFSSFKQGDGTNLEPLQISKISCDYIETANETGSIIPRFSWIATSPLRGVTQTAYQIVSATTPERLRKGSYDSWNSGKVVSGQTLHIPYGGKVLIRNKPCYFRVTIWDNLGHSAVSAIEKFQSAMPGQNQWMAKWIGDGPAHDPLPAKGFFSGSKEEGSRGDSVFHNGRSVLLRREFRLSGKVQSATAFVTGLGLYELYINGKPVGEQQLSPSKTPYHKQILFDTYDVTKMIVAGNNALGLHLGNGWYNPYKKWWQEYRMQWFGSKKAILQLQVILQDGTRETILTDGSWKMAPGPSIYNCIYDGEIYDATQEINGWADAGFDDISWKHANVVEAPKGKLTASDLPAIKIIERIDPAKITQPKEGVKIYDFGQNFAGWTTVTLKGKRGAKIRIRYSEELDAHGNLDVSCNENAKATAEYILKGEGVEVYSPHFTYFGFQYAEITADTTFPDILKMEACVVHSDNQPVGTFSCDNELVNKIHKATVWSQKSNMLGYPMDCPQRDERLGWMGDAQVTAEEAMFNFDMARFYKNWLQGIRENQDAATGDISIISPRPYIKDEGVEWSSTYLTMVWDCYRYYGDKQLIRDHYEAMGRYFQFLIKHANGVIQPKGWIGDWGSRAKNWKEGDPESVPTAYFYLDAVLLSKMAGVTGQKQDSLYFAGMAQKIKEAYNSLFFRSGDNSYLDGSQMANAFPLYLGLVPDNRRGFVLANLVKQIMGSDSGHLTTGVLGTKYLPEALSAEERSDIAWKLVNYKGYPGWEEMMKRYNTMCEFWTLKQSHNHVMMGSIDSWFYETLAGVKLSEEFPAYEKTIIKPYFAEGLNRVICSLQTVRGNFSSGWERNGSTLKLNMEIPFNCQSEVWIPNKGLSEVLESGKLVSRQKEIILVRKTGNFNVYKIGSGRYSFEVRYPAGKF